MANSRLKTIQDHLAEIAKGIGVSYDFSDNKFDGDIDPPYDECGLISALLSGYLDHQQSIKNNTIGTQPEERGERLRIAGEAWQYGWARGHSEGADIENFTNHPTKEQYLSQIK